MASPYWPTVGELDAYLTSFGFVRTDRNENAVYFEHPEDKGCWFLFRRFDKDRPAREMDLLDARAMLTGRGFVSDDEFKQFWNQHAPRVLRTPETTS